MQTIMLLFWVILIIIFVVVEVLTVQLVSIWFALGALSACIATLFNASTWIQWLIFIFTTIATLCVTRPIVNKFLIKGKQPTNADRNIGKTAIVVEEISNIDGRGRVRIDGMTWAARSLDGSVLREEQIVVIERIEGAKLIVKEYKKPTATNIAEFL